MQTAISHIFSFFFFSLKGDVGQREPIRRCFPNLWVQHSAAKLKNSCCSCKKKDKQVPFMSAMSSWKCHSFVTKEQSMPGVCSFKRSLNSNKKIFTSGRGHRQRAWVKEAKFRWQIIAVAVCPIMVLPLLALTDPIKERKPRVKTAILLLIDPTGPDKTHLFTSAPFIMMEQSGWVKRSLVTSLAVVPIFSPLPAFLN